jgi:hypothetical protein
MNHEYLHYIFSNEQKFKSYNEVYFLKELIKKIFIFMNTNASEWISCEHEYDNYPFRRRRCLKCNLFADEVEILMLCKEIIKKDML